LLALSSSLYLAVKERVTRLVIVLTLLSLLRLNNWKLTLGGSISSSNGVINMLEFLVLLGASDIMFVARGELSISNITAPG
jgi:hypothetical protein